MERWLSLRQPDGAGCGCDSPPLKGKQLRKVDRTERTSLRPPFQPVFFILSKAHAAAVFGRLTLPRQRLPIATRVRYSSMGCQPCQVSTNARTCQLVTSCHDGSEAGCYNHLWIVCLPEAKYRRIQQCDLLQVCWEPRAGFGSKSKAWSHHDTFQSRGVDCQCRGIRALLHCYSFKRSGAVLSASKLEREADRHSHAPGLHQSSLSAPWTGELNDVLGLDEVCRVARPPTAGTWLLWSSIDSAR